MDISKIKTSSSLEEKGITVQFDEETSFTIASLNSRRYKEAFANKMEELRRKTRRPTPDQSQEAMLECYADAILIGWNGLKENGAEVPYSKEKAFEYLKTCPSLRDFVSATASDYSNFNEQRTEEAKAELGKS